MHKSAMNFTMLRWFLVLLATGASAMDSGIISDSLRATIKRLYNDNVVTKAFSNQSSAGGLNLLNAGYVGYRLGDIIQSPGHDFNDIGQTWTRKFSSHAEPTDVAVEPRINIGDFATILWPDSIGADIVNAYRRCGQHNAVTEAIIKARCPKPMEPHTVVHLRIGDQLDHHLEGCRDDLTFNTCAENRMLRPNTMAHIASLLKKEPAIRGLNVVFVTGIHRASEPHDGQSQEEIENHLRASHTVSRRYIEAAQRSFAIHGFNSTVVSDTPDCDFCMMYTAKFLLPTRSAFSKSAARITKAQVIHCEGTGQQTRIKISQPEAQRIIDANVSACARPSKPLVCQHFNGAMETVTNTSLEFAISYSLYGSNPRYTDGAIANAKLIKTVYPNWVMRVYYDSTVPPKLIHQLQADGVQLVDMSHSNINKMSWRFQATENTARSCSRDIDSRLSRREAVAVQEWIQSGKKFHVMRDHPSHSSHSISGGMWCSTTIPNMRALLTNVTNQAYAQDMNFLKKVIWPMAQKSLLQHDSFSCEKFGGGKPFPTPRQGWEHVGSVYTDGKMQEGHIRTLKNAGIVEKCVVHKINPAASTV